MSVELQKRRYAYGFYVGKELIFSSLWYAVLLECSYITSFSLSVFSLEKRGRLFKAKKQINKQAKQERKVKNS